MPVCFHCECVFFPKLLYLANLSRKIELVAFKCFHVVLLGCTLTSGVGIWSVILGYLLVSDLVTLT